MDKFRLVNPFEMLSEANRLTITSDINHAMIEYGFMIKADFMKWMFYENYEKPGKVNDLVLNMAGYFAVNESLPLDLIEQLAKKTDQYLYDLPPRRRIALSFILLNSEDFHESVSEITYNPNYTEAEKKRVLGREVEQEIYVAGSYNLEKKIHEYLMLEVCKFTKEFNRTIEKLSSERILKIIDIYSNNSIAKLGCEMVS